MAWEKKSLWGGNLGPSLTRLCFGRNTLLTATASLEVDPEAPPPPLHKPGVPFKGLPRGVLKINGPQVPVVRRSTRHSPSPRIRGLRNQEL